MALRQLALIDRVTSVCRADRSLAAALTYGSFAQGIGDAYSDIEFWLFFAEPVSPLHWLAAVAPYEHVVVNEFGSHVVFFPGLIRGEFHFATSAEIVTVESWPARSAPVSSMLLVDRTGELGTALASLPDAAPVPSSPESVAELCGRFANWLVLAHHVTQRGELLRAQDARSHARRQLLWMIRLAERRTGNWLTPSRQAEAELPADAVAAAASADLAALWRCGRDYWSRLAVAFGFAVPEDLFVSLDAALLS
jgi:lincosamide nucleotidyltransferase B/F